LYGRQSTPVHNWIYGLGGRDYDLRQAAEVIEQLQNIAAGEELEDVNLLGIRL
jgi:hypothetical protein